jgi:hypothetical protein
MATPTPACRRSEATDYLRQDLSAPGPELKDRLDADAATEAFLEHEFDRMLPGSACERAS